MSNPILNKFKNVWKGYSAFERKKFPFVYLLIAFPVLQMIVFWFYVNLSGVFLAFQDASGKFSFDAFKAVFDAFRGEDPMGMSDSVTSMLGKSMFIWFSNHIVINIIGILSTFILTKHMIGHKFFRTCYMIPGLLGTVVFVSIMRDFYADTGVLVALVQKLDIDVPFTVIREGFLGNDKTAFPTLMVQMYIWGFAGGGLILSGAYMRIPQEVFESANIDGCGFFREAFQIAIPCVWPTLSTMMVFSLCSFFTADYSMYLYSVGQGTKGLNSIGFYTYYIKVQISNGATVLYSYSSAFGLVLTAITLPVVFLGRWLLSKLGDNVEF